MRGWPRPAAQPRWRRIQPSRSLRATMPGYEHHVAVVVDLVQQPVVTHAIAFLHKAGRGR